MNKTALITGASGGIGYEFAILFAQHKYDLVLVARSEAKLKEIAEQITNTYNVKVKVYSKDLSIITSIDEVYNSLKSENIYINVLINNAGFGDFGFFKETDWNKEQQMINLNITSLTYLTKLFVKDMILAKDGKILNLSSTAAFQPGPLMAVYFATKAYVLSFSEAIANELKGTGVTVTALCPGPTESGFAKAAAAEDTKLFKDKKMPSSKEVALFGFDALMKGKTVVIHGLLNKIMAFSIRLSPRKMVTMMVRMMSEQNKA